MKERSRVNVLLYLGLFLFVIGMAGELAIIPTAHAEIVEDTVIETPSYSVCEYCLATKVFGFDYVPEEHKYEVVDGETCMAVIKSNGGVARYTCLRNWMIESQEEIWEN